MEIKFSYLSHTVLYPSCREELKESWRRSEPWVVKRPIMFSVVFWPVVILHNRFFKAKLDRTRHAGSHFLTEYWPRPMVSCSDSNCSYFSLIENHLINWVLGWFFTLEVGLPVVDRMTVAAEFECSLQFIFVSLACVANDRCFWCSSWFSCKSLFTWKWGTPGRRDNLL